MDRATGLPNAPLIEAHRLRREAAGQTLLDDVSLALRGGDRVALVGPSGSGKTLLLRALALLDQPDAGQLRWRGEPVAGSRVPAYRSRVIYQHQRPALLEGTVEENLRAPFSLRVHRQKQFRRKRALELLDALGRDGSFLAKQQRDLSGGEAQIVALLRAVQLDPDVLLLDEPTAALDAHATGLVERLVARWLDEQPGERAALWVTHDERQARRVAKSVWEIRGGRLEGGVS